MRAKAVNNEPPADKEGDDCGVEGVTVIGAMGSDSKIFNDLIINSYNPNTAWQDSQE
jgi:hypothetical protein